MTVPHQQRFEHRSTAFAGAGAGAMVQAAIELDAPERAHRIERELLAERAARRKRADGTRRAHGHEVWRQAPAAG
jgi:hypothetical protein